MLPLSLARAFVGTDQITRSPSLTRRHHHHHHAITLTPSPPLLRLHHPRASAPRCCTHTSVMAAAAAATRRAARPSSGIQGPPRGTHSRGIELWRGDGSVHVWSLWPSGLALAGRKHERATGAIDARAANNRGSILTFCGRSKVAVAGVYDEAPPCACCSLPSQRPPRPRVVTVWDSASRGGGHYHHLPAAPATATASDRWETKRSRCLGPLTISHNGINETHE